MAFSVCLGMFALHSSAPILARGWPQLSLSQVGVFDEPVHITGAGDGSGRLFIVEMTGKIRIVRNGAVQSTPFLDLTSLLDCGDGRKRLLSLAFPPGYSSLGHFYVKYLDKSCNIVVARFRTTGNPDIADINSRQIIISQPVGLGLFGGPLYFGPFDGYLYVSFGDGSITDSAPGNAAQDPTTLLGKVLRIDVETNNPATYSIPPTNPYAVTPGYRPEIWASGFRNPWRFSFDRQTGDLYVGDVGSTLYEEVNFQPANSPGGEDYGWKTMEAAHCFGSLNCTTTGLVLPVVEYDHTLGNCSITGGSVYRGSSYPDLQGIYLYGDWCSGRIWGSRRTATAWETAELAQPPIQVVTFGEDDDGNVYVGDYNGGGVYRLGSTGTSSALSSLILSSTSVYGSAATTGNRVSLNTSAPSGGYYVTLSSSDPLVAAVPASVLVLSGATTSESFSISTQAVPIEKIVTITASADGITRTATLTVSPLALSNLTVSPTSLNASSPGTLNWVSLNGPAPPGSTVSLSSSNAAVAAVPGTVVVPEGTTASLYFTITASPVQAATPVTITASYTTSSGWSTFKSASLTVFPTPSPDGTMVLWPATTQIVDSLGAAWTISPGQVILRNGAPAAGGSGVKMLWSSGSIYVLGSTGGSWWKWLGAGWTNVGTTDPGGAVTPPPPPPSGTTSADGTVVPPATQIVDASGAVWTMNGGLILRNGASAAGGSGVKMLWSSGSIYVLGSTGGSWWKWLGAGWTNVGTTDPGGAVTPPPPPPSGTTSADGTVVPPGAQIVDALGAVWTMNGGAVLRNGVSAAGGSGVKLLWSGGSIYVLGSPGGNWWKWLGAGWTNVGVTQPGGTVTPPPPPPPPSGTTSSDGTVVPPATQIVDALGAVWTLAGEVVLRNGAPASSGTGFKILWLRGTVYVLGSDNSRWWQWTGAGWAYFGTVQPV